jgi:hypothetical protein
MIANPDFSKAASNLGKRRTRVFLRGPVVQGFDGQAYVYQGAATIHVKPEPGFDARTTAYILAHESAHILQGTASNTDPALPPGSRMLTPIGKWARKAAQEPGGNESRSDEQAAIWMDYCDKYWKRYPAPTELESRLKCLAEYPLQGILDRVQTLGAAAGKAAALKVYNLEEVRK